MLTLAALVVVIRGIRRAVQERREHGGIVFEMLTALLVILVAIGLALASHIIKALVLAIFGAGERTRLHLYCPGADAE